MTAYKDSPMIDMIDVAASDLKRAAAILERENPRMGYVARYLAAELSRQIPPPVDAASIMHRIAFATAAMAWNGFDGFTYRQGTISERLATTADAIGAARATGSP